MAHEVFVSYSTSDKPIADAVCATLERHGIRCWIAPRDILPGLDWGAAIIDAIGASKVMVLVFSASANKSSQIKREVERAVHKGVTIIPLRIEDVPLAKTLEYFISSSHWLDAFSPSVEAHLDRLAETVKLLLARVSRESAGIPVPRPAAAAAAPPLAPPPPPPVSSPVSSPAVAAAAPERLPSGAAPAPKPAGVSSRAIMAVAALVLLVVGGSLLATRGHSPHIVSVEFPAVIPAGQKGNGVIRYTDKKGDVALAKFDVLQGSSFRDWTMEITGMAGQTSGSYTFWLSSPVAEHVSMRVTLIDNDGKKSSPTTFAFDIQPAPSPARQAPQPRRKPFEIQAPNGMKFKVN